MCSDPDIPPPVQPASTPGTSAQLEPLTEEQLALRSRRNSSGIFDAVRTAMMIPSSARQTLTPSGLRFRERGHRGVSPDGAGGGSIA